MKKYVSVLGVFFAACVASVHAGLIAPAVTGSGVGNHLGGENALAAGSWAGLVWSADSTPVIPPYGSLPSSAGAWGDDYLLTTWWTDGDASFGGMPAAQYNNTAVGGAEITGGKLYAVFFETAANTQPQVGTWYGISTLASCVDAPTATEVNVGVLYTDQGQVVAVPEPTTIALLGVGAAVVAMRRRSKK